MNESTHRRCKGQSEIMYKNETVFNSDPNKSLIHSAWMGGREREYYGKRVNKTTEPNKKEQDRKKK